MADIKKGDRVYAIKDVGGGWSATVKKGTNGTVVGVEEHFISATEFSVRFDNGKIETVTEKEIYLGEN